MYNSARLHCLQKITLVVAVALAGALPLGAEPISQLRPSNYVNDFAGVLDAATETRLNSIAKQIDEKAKAQIAVVTVKSTDGEDIVSYSVELYQKWGIGKKGTDRGVLILLAVQDRKYRTAVGYGLEPILPDGKVGGFGREAVPLLRASNYAGAVSLMTARVAQVIANDAGVTLEGAEAPLPQPAPAQPDASGAGVIVLLIFAGIFIVVIWALIRAKGGGGSGPRGGGSGFLSGLLWGILLDSMRSRDRGSWGGGSSWGGGGFGGGGGGFGGFGGGSTGGGGAGGSW